MSSRLVGLSALIFLIWLAGAAASPQSSQEPAKPPSGEWPTPARESAAQPSEELVAIRELSGQIAELSKGLSEMQAQWRTLIEMEVLTRAEHRAEALRAQLLDLQTKEIDLRARIEDLNYQLQPQNLQRALAFVGGVRMDELRDDLRKRIENEKRKASEQLELYTSNRERLEREIRDADAEVIRVRSRVSPVKR